ncbi:opioid-binding protein/cell adhesion molecule-like isoform X2 [Oscarella lobularis]|uniref:opioid-binding protein/cell adhesion molecule-like isoform X2 n=1 Tax=Oscarella lobularis TaxID=121494 RepID=UPI0033142E39
MKSCVVQLLLYFTIETGSSTVNVRLASSAHLLPGQNALFSCSVTAPASSSFRITRWEKGGTALNLNDSRYTSNPTLESFSIHQVTKTDTGLYYCVATIDGAEKSDVAYLDVLVNPEISFNPLTVAAEGDSVTLGCPSAYFTSIRWTFNGVKTSRKLGYTYSKNNAFLTIDRVSRTQAGQYVCTAFNYYNYFATMGTPVLVVHYAPDVVVHGPSNGTVIQDDAVRLYCNASGVPPPRIRWEKDGVLVSDLRSSRYKIESEGKVLSIAGVLTSDTSNITCIANNSMGSSSDYCELTVEGKSATSATTKLTPAYMYPSTKGKSLAAIAGSVSGGVLLIAIFIVAVVEVRKKNKGRRQDGAAPRQKQCEAKKGADGAERGRYSCSDEDSRIDIIEEVKKNREEVREVRKDVAHLTDVIKSSQKLIADKQSTITDV